MPHKCCSHLDDVLKRWSEATDRLGEPGDVAGLRTRRAEAVEFLKAKQEVEVAALAGLIEGCDHCGSMFATMCGLLARSLREALIEVNQVPGYA